MAFTRQAKLSSTSVLFTVSPLWWQGSLFLFGFVVSLVAITLLISALVYRVQKNQRDKRNRLEKQILEYKLVALKAQVNPHFVSNCLTAIQQLVMGNKVR